jgi:hypothetical protein
MGIAFPALFIIAILLPGILFRYALSKGNWTSTASIRPITEEAVYSVLWALALHFIAGIFCATIDMSVNYRAVLVLLIGTNNIDGAEFQEALKSFSLHTIGIGIYFLTLCLISFVSGFFFHNIVRRYRLDHKTRLLRFQNEWYYLLSGEILLFDENKPSRNLINTILDRNIITYITAVVEQGSATYLYRGIFAGFFYYDANNALDRIFLASAHRRLLEADREQGRARNPNDLDYKNDERYYDIEGSYLILRYSEVKTFNIEYISIE